MELDRRAVLGAGLAAGVSTLAGGARAQSTADPSKLVPPAVPVAPNSAIDARTLAEAAKIHAIQIPADAAEAVLGQVQAQVAVVQALRKLPRPRDLQPAFRFDPRMPGKSYKAQANKQVYAPGATPSLPASDDDIAFAPVTILSRWIKDGKLSSARLVEIYLARIARYDARLHSFITVTADRARADARALDLETKKGKWRGPLHGIPYGLKDVIDTAKIPTSWGSSLFKDRVPDKDATIVTMLRKAGAVMLGKAATAELANGATWFGGEVRNPWNPEEPSGGSSCGPGAAVAAGFCAFAIGTDSLGSILNPSDRCGIVGLRPTFGRIPVAGGMPLTPTLERIGPMCRGVEDAAMVLAVINGPDPTSINSIDMGFAYDAKLDLSKLRIGYSPTWFQKIGFGMPTDAPVAEGHLKALQLAKESGASVVEVEMPDLPYGALIQNLGVEAAAVFEDLTLNGSDAKLIAPWANMWRTAHFFSAVDYLQMERFRRQVMQAMDAIFDRVDMVIAPTYGNFNLLLVTNFTGHPGLTMRCGFEQKRTRGLGQDVADPNGALHTVTCNVSLHGRLFEEGKMLAFARVLESKLNVADRRPNLA